MGDGKITQITANSLEHALAEVRSKIEPHLPKIYMGESAHLSDCHMVHKLTKAVYGKGPMPGKLTEVGQSVVGLMANMSVGGAQTAKYGLQGLQGLQDGLRNERRNLRSNGQAIINSARGHFEIGNLL